jgi:hypothetical protein
MAVTKSVTMEISTGLTVRIESTLQPDEYRIKVGWGGDSWHDNEAAAKQDLVDLHAELGVLLGIKPAPAGGPFVNHPPGTRDLEA